MSNDDAAIAALQVEVHHLTEGFQRLEKKVDSLTSQANYAKVAVVGMLALGGMLGSIITAVVSWRLK